MHHPSTDEIGVDNLKLVALISAQHLILWQMTATFSHSEICEVFQLSTADLNSIIYARGLLLASDQPGPFNARKFCLADAYLIAFALDLINLTRRGADACRAIERLAWFDRLETEDAIREARGLPKLTANERLRMRDELRFAACIEPHSIHPAFCHRDLTEPFLLIADDHLETMRARIIPQSALWLEGASGIRTSWLINVTRALDDVDRNIRIMRGDA
jgi:hypothetical protein